MAVSGSVVKRIIYNKLAGMNGIEGLRKTLKKTCLVHRIHALDPVLPRGSGEWTKSDWNFSE
ncbi:unnamed protein product, partial [Nesidiocoris tenuis]